MSRIAGQVPQSALVFHRAGPGLSQVVFCVSVVAACWATPGMTHMRERNIPTYVLAKRHRTSQVNGSWSASGRSRGVRPSRTGAMSSTSWRVARTGRQGESWAFVIAGAYLCQAVFQKRYMALEVDYLSLMSQRCLCVGGGYSCSQARIRFELTSLGTWANTRGSSDVALHDVLYIEQIAEPTCQRRLSAVADSVAAEPQGSIAFRTLEFFDVESKRLA
jgi:hypothetical protein